MPGSSRVRRALRNVGVGATFRESVARVTRRCHRVRLRQPNVCIAPAFASPRKHQPSPVERNHMSTTTAAEQTSAPIEARGGIWGRQLGRYPSNGPRAFYLGIVILATIVLYYELYVGGAVATKVSADLDMSL